MISKPIFDLLSGSFVEIGNDQQEFYANSFPANEQTASLTSLV